MRVAFVTGSGKKRVGFHVARALGQQGCDIILHYHSSKDEAEQSVRDLNGEGISTIALQADLTNETEVERLFTEIQNQKGRLDVLVNCASVWTRKKLEDTMASDVRDCFDANVLSSFLCAKHAGLMMVNQPEGGCIVNVGDWAISRPYVDHLAYFIAKGTLPTMTHALAVELAARNPKVRVNCVHPGPVMLPSDLPESEKEAAINATLVKREGSPENVAQAVVALVQNDFITGVCLPVDGGRTIYAPER